MATSAGKVAFTLEGTYDAATTYSILDVVSYGGGSYAAKGTTVGNLPTDTTYWQRLASAGEGGGGAKYGTSQTSGATADKVVATVYTDFELETGASVLVYFANADTAGSITLNVDGTGAKTVKMNGSVLPSNFLANNTIYQFIYNGTDYVLVSGAEQTAERTPYDNNLSGLTADNVQGAIDELDGNITSNATSISTLGTEKANNSALANVELTTTATASHAVGTYFILGGQFVRTTVAIEVGDTIAIGTNVVATDVGSVLTELNSKSFTKECVIMTGSGAPTSIITYTTINKLGKQEPGRYNGCLILIFGYSGDTQQNNQFIMASVNYNRSELILTRFASASGAYEANVSLNSDATLTITSPRSTVLCDLTIIYF